MSCSLPARLPSHWSEAQFTCTVHPWEVCINTHGSHNCPFTPIKVFIHRKHHASPWSAFDSSVLTLFGGNSLIPLLGSHVLDLMSPYHVTVGFSPPFFHQCKSVALHVCSRCTSWLISMHINNPHNFWLAQQSLLYLHGVFPAKLTPQFSHSSCTRYWHSVTDPSPLNIGRFMNILWYYHSSENKWLGFVAQS